MEKVIKCQQCKKEIKKGEGNFKTRLHNDKCQGEFFKGLSTIFRDIP